LLPEENNLANWPSIACDQYTSQPEYWEDLLSKRKHEFSSSHLILPEAIYKSDRVEIFEERLNNLLKTHKEYLKQFKFREFKDHPIFVVREIAGSKRIGILMLFDLEFYENQSGETHLIATEQTDESRLFQRYLIRNKSIFELSHSLVFYDDPYLTFNDFKSIGPQIYKVNLGEKYGLLKGYLGDSKEVEVFFNRYFKNKKLIVGDGNHSLAAAKRYWDSIKVSLNFNEFQNDPHRFHLI
jgi:hypothetical protein